VRAHRNCCGLDVHKKMIAACVIREDVEGNSVTEKHLFGSMTRELHELAQWLCAAQVTAVAMEGRLLDYIRFVERFAQHFHDSPDRLGPRHIPEYQAHLFTEGKLSPGTVTNHRCPAPGPLCCMNVLAI